MATELEVPTEVQAFIAALPPEARPRFGTQWGAPCLLLSSPQDTATARRAEALGFRPLENAPGWAFRL